MEYCQYISHESHESLSDVNTDVDTIIINERNKEFLLLSQEMECISEISESLNALVNEQRENIEIAEKNIVSAEDNCESGTVYLGTANNITQKLRSMFTKGAIVSTGVTGAGAMTVILLNPIAGGIAAIIGVGGLVFCIVQLNQ